ncbi:MAG: hypothetical protein ABFR90_12165, partial [Planctomycetota bacterium]
EIYQTPQVHQKIGAYLEKLREELSKQIEIETRFLLVTDNFLEDIGLDVSLPADYETSGGVGELVVGPANSAEILAALEHKPLAERKLPPVISLSDMNTQPTSKLVQPTQKLKMLDDLQNEFLIRATQAHRNAKQLQAPKAMVLNNEAACMQVTTDVRYKVDSDGQTKDVSKGLTLDILPTMQDDDKEVLLKGHMQLVDILEMQEHGEGDKAYLIPVVQVANIPIHAVVKSGGTILIEGPELTRTKEIVTNPGMSKIPILGRRFSNRSIVDERYRILILIKPTVIKPEEVGPEPVVGALAPRTPCEK